MGIQVRKRTKGKSGWWNGSYSSKGVGVSGSVKAGKNVTYNTGDLSGNKKTPSRLTVNLGNGVKWVSYGSTKKAKYSNNESSGILAIIVVVIGFVVGMFLIAALIGLVSAIFS